MHSLLFCLLLAGWQDPVQKPPAIQQPAIKGDSIWNDVVSFEIKTYDGMPTSLEQAITQALTRHPEMQLAQAELRVAEAKLAQARIVVSQKVTEDFHRLQKEQADVELAKAKWERISQMQKNGAISKEEADAAQQQLAGAKARLATTESSWKLIMGNQAQTGFQINSDGTLYRTGSISNEQFSPHRKLTDQLDFLGITRLQGQPSFEVFNTIRVNSDANTDNTLDQLKSHLGTRVKMEKQNSLNLEQAFQKVTEGAGLNVRVKLPITENKALYKVITQVDIEASDYPLHTWLQLIVDEMNNQQAMTAQQGKEMPRRFELYVREYGLLLTSRDLAPPDAMTVQELWKQARLEKAAKEAKKVQENAAPKK